jgi:ABC-type transport system involved in cytochrome c biogenesis permease subunit
MKSWSLRAVLTALTAGALAFAISALIVDTANGTPHQPNVPVFTYGSQ